MSKPVTNVEIEDVLSSIRRLVSSSDRVERPAEPTSDEGAERLVLTPSLRVDGQLDDRDNNDKEQGVISSSSRDEIADEADVEKPEEVADEAAAETEFFDLVTQSVSQESEEVQGTDDDADAYESETSEVTQTEEMNADDLAENEDNSSRFEADMSSEEERSAEFATAEDGDQAEAQNEDPDSGRMSSVLDLRKRAVEFETVVAERDDAWDPDGTTEDDNAGTHVGSLPWSLQDDDSQDETTAPDDEVDMALAAAVFRRSRPSTNDDVTPKDVTPEIAEAVDGAEVVLADAASKAEEDGIHLSDIDLDQVMADLVETSSAAPEEAEEEPSTDEAASLEAEPVSFAFRDTAKEDAQAPKEESESDIAEPVAIRAIEESLLDEDALRDMVSDIVRQELQGALGERITRNVRKLVRREIHRALASQELE